MKNKMQEIFYGHLDRLIYSHLSYAVWGAGKTGIETLALIKDYTKGEFLPEFIIDNNPALWERVDIVSPTLFFANHKEKIDTVFVCVYVADEVEEQLRREGFTGNVVPVSTTAMGKNGYVEFFENHEEDVQKVFSVLADERSVDTIKILREVSITGDISLWRRVNGKSIDKLLDQEILVLGEDETFVDVGAFIGDSTKRFLEITGGKYNKIIGLEPDPENYNVLKKEYATLKNAVAIQIAVGREDCEVRFEGHKSESGRISPSGDLIVGQIRLDSIDEAKGASFIKTSTNGNDYKSIAGAEELIVKYSPKMSYYCGGTKMWWIPWIIRKNNPNYRFYIRHYGIGTQGLIGYAIVG